MFHQAVRKTKEEMPAKTDFLLDDDGDGEDDDDEEEDDGEDDFESRFLITMRIIRVIKMIIGGWW